jgi:hypothetical protein
LYFAKCSSVACATRRDVLNPRSASTRARSAWRLARAHGIHAGTGGHAEGRVAVYRLRAQVRAGLHERIGNVQVVLRNGGGSGRGATRGGGGGGGSGGGSAPWKLRSEVARRRTRCARSRSRPSRAASWWRRHRCASARACVRARRARVCVCVDVEW